MQVDHARAAILHNLQRRGFELKDFGQSIGMSQKSGYIKFHNPERITVEDLRLMKASVTEVLEIVGVKDED